VDAKPDWDAMSDDEYALVVAYHEAGHAALDVLFGHKLETVTIRAEDGRAAGYAEKDRSEHDMMRYEDMAVKQIPFERAIMAALGGAVAQRKFAAHTIDDSLLADDYALVNEYLDELECESEQVREAYLRRLQLRTEVLIEQNWPQVCAIAHGLVERGTMTGAEVRTVYMDTTAKLPFAATASSTEA
jgi:hypothetical protein